MIIKGNYVWLDFDKIRPMMKQVFTEYYGEENSEHLNKVIDEIKYNPYHKFDYVNEYYKQYIFKFKKEILNNFFQISGITKSKKITEAMFPQGLKDFDEAPINLIMGAECRNDIYNQIKSHIENGECEHFKKLFDAFDLDINNQKDSQMKLTRILHNYMQAIKQVENTHTCDVFKDMQTIEHNFNEGMVDLANTAISLGLPVSEDDKILIELYKNNPKFSLFDNVNKLDIGEYYFDRDLSLPGLVDYFSTKYDDKLKNSKDINKYSILVNRLRYLFLQGAEFEILDKDEVLHFGFNNGNNEDFYKRLTQEYKIQCIKNPDLIVTPEKADLMEMKRLELEKKEYLGCKYNANAKNPTKSGSVHPVTLERAGALMSNEFVNDIYNRDFEMFYDEGLRDDPYAIICAMCHEINHAISNKVKIQDSYSAIDYMGLLAQGFAMEYGDFKAYVTDEPDLEFLYENINQRQAKELAEIYFENFDTKGVITGDIVIDDEYYDCKYEFADFLTSEFYNMFYDELKRNNVDKNYEPYYNVNLYNDKIGKTTSKLSSFYNRHMHKKEYFTDIGDMDYHKVVKLGKLVNDWLGNYIDLLYENEITAEDLTTGVCMGQFDYKMYKTYQNFIRRKDAIIKDMFKDKTTSSRLRNEKPKMIRQEDIDYITDTLEENNLM